MDAWAWIAVYVVGFALLQLVLFRYVSDGQQLHEASPEMGTAADRTPMEHEPQADRQEEGVQYCNNCGARNEKEQSFSYCRECVQPL